MHFPWWYVPSTTAPMLIALVSVIHMLVAHYAVGGGLFLAVETTHAHRTGNREYLLYLKRHARFFVLLTVVFGAITGVGIWWTIGLASPLATRVLIRLFVFAWGVEYVAFLIEIVSAFIFYYYWERLSPRIHCTMVWIYAVSAWISLAIIAAITSFMLDPGTWPKDHDFWSALCNRQALPQIISRTGGSLLLSSLYVFLHAALTIKEEKLHSLIESRSTRPAMLGAVLIMVGGVLWHIYLPDSARAAIAGAAVLNVFVAVLFGATAAVFVLLYLGPYRNPGWIASPGFAACLLLFGVTGLSTAEFIREAVRKPYIIYRVVLGSQEYPEEIEPLRKSGFLDGGVWTKAYVQIHYPDAFVGSNTDAIVGSNTEKHIDQHIDTKRLLALPKADRVLLGGLIFQYHCNDCHAPADGYSAVGGLVQGWSPSMIHETVTHLDETRFTMPPWSGNDDEAVLLGDYLSSIAPLRPAGILPPPNKN